MSSFVAIFRHNNVLNIARGTTDPRAKWNQQSGCIRVEAAEWKQQSGSSRVKACIEGILCVTFWGTPPPDRPL